MMRWLRFLLVLLVPCLCTAEPVPAVAYRITGVAVSTRDGARIPYCRFQVSPGQADGLADRPAGGPLRGGLQRQNQTGLTQVFADVHGRFQIDVPGPGRWRVQASARNFRLQDFEAHDGFFSSIALTATAPAMDVVFRLVPDGVLTGLVRDEAGEAVRNAQVVAETPAAERTRGAWRPAGFVQTDDRGRYEMSGLAPGTYRLRVQAQPWYAQGARRMSLGARLAPGGPVAVDPALDVVYAPVWFPGVDDESRAEPIVLGGGEERQADFQLVAIASTHLKIPVTETVQPADSPPRPRGNAMVTKVSPAGGFGPTSSTTDGSGTDFGGLSPGVYEVRQIGPDGRPEDAARQFRVLGGAGGVIDLGTAQPLVRVQLLADGVADARLNEVIFVDTATGRSMNSNSTRSEGFFEGGRRRPPDEAPRDRVAFLAPGSYEVYLPPNGPDVLTGLSATGARVTGLTVQIADGSPTLMLHLATGKGEISGTAMMAGKPVSGVMTLLVPATLGQPGDLTPIRRDQTNTDGGFLIRAVIPGRYILVAIQDGWGLKWQDPATLAPYLSKGLPVEITAEGKLVENIVAQLP